MFWLSQDGLYHGGDRQPGDIEVLERTDPTFVWDGGTWRPTAATSNAPLLAEMAALEATVTERMWREDAMSSTVVMAFGPDDPRTGKTASQYIAFIDARIEALRVQLVKV